jgi:hypothetical protein
MRALCVGHPRHDGQLGYEKRRDQRVGVLEAAGISRQDHAVVTDAEEARLVRDLAVEDGLSIEPVVLVVAQHDCAGGAVPAQAFHLADNGLLALAPHGRNQQVEGAGRGVPVLVVLMLGMKAGELGRDVGGVCSRRLPAAALGLGAQISLQVRPRAASSSSASAGPWLPASYGVGGGPDSQASRIGSTTFHSSSTSSARVNSVASPRSAS